MTWWAWLIVWLVLVLSGGLVLFVTARRLYRQGMALARELGAAADAFAEVGSAVQTGADARAKALATGRDTAGARPDTLTRAPSGRRGTPTGGTR